MTQDKSPPPLPPLKIPEQSIQCNDDDNVDDGWGESKTPGADEHMKLSPLGENAFDSPENSMSETQLHQEFAAKLSPESTQQQQQPQQQQQQQQQQQHQLPPTHVQLQDSLCILLQQKDNLMQTPQSADRDHRVLLLQKQIMLTQQQINLKMQPMTTLQHQQPLTSNFLPPIGTRPPNPNVSNNFQSSLQAGNNYTVKMQQLDAITRCLQTPSGLLDNKQMNQLQLRKEVLQKELQDEASKQAGALLQMNETLPKPIPPQLQQQSSAYFNEHFNLMQNREPLVMQQNTVSGSKQSTTELLTDIRKQTLSPSTQQDNHQGVLLGEKVSNHKVSSQGKLEITHTSMIDSQPKPKNFVLPPYDVISTETKSNWIARELLNLEHNYFTHPKTRYFSIINYEYQGQFWPSLKRTYQTGVLMLTDLDSQVFKREWANNDGPVFLIVRYKLLDGTWMAGGLIQVLSKVEDSGGSSRSFKSCCKAKIVSSAIVNDLPWLRSDKMSREVSRETAFRFLQFTVARLQEGKLTNLFRFQDKQIQKVRIQDNPRKIITSNLMLCFNKRELQFIHATHKNII